MNVGLRSRPWAGLDVGDWSVKLLALQPGVGGLRPFVAELPLPRPTPEAILAPEAVAQVISECLALAGLSARGLRGLTLGISGGDVIVKQVALPIMDDQEVAGALRFEARKHLPFDPQSCVIDYQILGRMPSERRLDVLLAAVPQSRIDRMMAPLRLLGMEPDIVDAAPLALTNALAREAERDNEARLLLDIGHEGSWLTLHQRGLPYFSRRLEFGGATVTRSIADALRVPVDEAEEWKVEAGADEPSMRVTPDSPEMTAVGSCLQTLAEEVHRSLAFYRTMGPLPEPINLWLSGHTARLPGIAGRLSQLLEVATLVFDPLESLRPNMAGNTPSGGPQYAQAYGLALRAA